MNKIEEYVYKKTLSAVLSRPCPNQIPRTGEAGARADCFEIRVYKDKKPFLLVKDLTNAGVEGLAYDNGGY